MTALGGLFANRTASHGLAYQHQRRRQKAADEAAFAEALAEFGWTMTNAQSVAAAAAKVGRPLTWGYALLRRMRAELGGQGE